MGFNKTVFIPFIILSIHCISITNTPLIFSNYPEAIHYPQTIFNHQTTQPTSRIHFYHINKTSQTLFQHVTIQNNSSSDTTLNIQQKLNKDYDGSKASHKNAQLFWQSQLNQSFTQITIPANGHISLDNGSLIFPKKVSHGIINIQNTNQTPLIISLEYKDKTYKHTPKNPLKPIIFSNNKISHHTVLPKGPKLIIPIGEKNTSKIHYNNGNYGQIHEINLNFINPYNYPLKSHIYYNRVSGMARNALLINNQLFNANQVLAINSPEKITTLTIPPQSTPHHQIYLFPESGNFYPIEIIVSSLRSSLNDS